MHLRIWSVLILLLILAVPKVRATHLYGMDIYYDHLVGNQYRISVAIYGDCSGSAFGSLEKNTPTVHVYDGVNWRDSLILTQSGPGVEVTPVCPRELNNTTCKSPTGTIPGVTRYIYTSVYTFPYASANWKFRFDGNTPQNDATLNPLGLAYSAGRSGAISNIQTANSTVTALEARLNNLAGSNSSPRFTTIPTPFYCINIPQQYNHGAVDANNDSLDYALVPGLRGGGAGGPAAGGGNVLYVSPYSGPAPMNGDVSAWSFSKTTGQLNFTPTAGNQYLIVNEIKEYRNGVVVGTSMREMTFIILASCNITPSESNLDTSKTYQDGVFVEKDRVVICQLTDTGQFAITPTNRSGDTIVASVAGLPAGVTDTIYSNNTPRPIIVLNWRKAGLAPGNYNFFVTYRDKGCPLSSQQTKAFTLQVVAPNDITGPTIIAPTQCAHKAWVHFTPVLGLTPRTITISKNGTVIKTYRDTTGAMIADSLAGGTYQVDILSDNLECPTRKSIVVVDSGEYPYAPAADDRFHCLDDPPMELRARADTGGVAQWFLPDGTPLPSAPIPQTTVAGITYYLVQQQVKICKSKRDTVWVYVTKRPVASISGDILRCEFDTGTYVFNGSIGVGPILEYLWSWDKAYYKNGDGPGPWKAAWGLAGSKRITLQVLENKCPSDSAELIVTVRPKPYAGFDMQEEVCQFDTVNIRYNTNPLDSQEFAWTFTSATLKNANSPGPFTLSWDTAGTKRVSLTVNVRGCSDTRYRDIIVKPTPDISILNTPGPVCMGEKIYLQTSGAISYTWYPEDSMRRDVNGVYTHVLKPSRFRVIGRNEFYCWDSASIDFPIVEPCCNFSYPNAFTPNNDGRNDKFNAVTYGHHLEYELNVYNRWGQRVFIGHSPTESWDGTFGGKLCDAGTYYWQLNALCYTGHREFQKGDVILIR